ncbi:MAG: hypothetical protein K2R98_24705 [Gemmataceae bacterium]|nr:hypothetical protein [Gemmataceae bacterium]
MTTEHEQSAPPPIADASSLEMPAPTFWPIVLASSITLLGMGLVTNWLFSIVGAIIFIVALGNWLKDLLPGHGHHQEELVPPEERARPVQEHRGEVEHLRPGMAGHRLRYPEKMHPYSAGVRGGIAGGLAMTIPALIYGAVSNHHSIWYPINLLAGMVINLPRLPVTAEQLAQGLTRGPLDIAALEHFNFRWFFVSLVIHAVTSVTLGLMYGVILPMLPGRPYLWGGLVAPLLWTGIAYGFMGVVNPPLREAVDWWSFVVAQFVYGIVAGVVVVRSEKVYAEPVRWPKEAELPTGPHGGNP